MIVESPDAHAMKREREFVPVADASVLIQLRIVRMRGMRITCHPQIPRRLIADDDDVTLTNRDE